MIFLYNDDDDISNFIHLNMKKWKTLFLCLLLNCDIERDKHQAPVNHTELTEITKMIYENFAALDRLRTISEFLNYDSNFAEKDNKDKTKENLNFFCDCSSEQIGVQKDNILGELEKKFSEGRLKDKKKLLDNIDKLTLDQNILEKYGLSADKNNIEDLLCKVIKRFLGYNVEFLGKLERELGIYKNNVVNYQKLESSVETFQKLSGYLEKFFTNYKKIADSNKMSQKHLIFLFFGNILPQYYNVYYENIFRLEKKEDGTYQTSLSLLNAIC